MHLSDCVEEGVTVSCYFIFSNSVYLGSVEFSWYRLKNKFGTN